MKEHIKNLQKIALHYGYDSQSLMLVEEMAELTQAISKYRRKVRNTLTRFNPDESIRAINAIAEEVADVRICLEQVEFLLGIEAQVERNVGIKVERTLKKIADGTD